MTPLLEQAFAKAQELPAAQQDSIAAMVLQEIREHNTGSPDLWTAIQKFRAEHDLSDLNVEEVFGNVRDRTPGREVEW
jgi:hypothetical protein